MANTALFLIYGLHDGINVAAAVGNVAIALIGNFIGGGIMIGLYYAYANDYRRAARRGYIDAPADGA